MKKKKQKRERRQRTASSMPVLSSWNLALSRCLMSTLLSYSLRRTTYRILPNDTHSFVLELVNDSCPWPIDTTDNRPPLQTQFCSCSIALVSAPATELLEYSLGGKASGQVPGEHRLCSSQPSDKEDLCDVTGKVDRLQSIPVNPGGQSHVI